MITPYEAPKGIMLMDALKAAKRLAATAPNLMVNMTFNETQVTVSYDSNLSDVYSLWVYKREYERLTK